MDYSLFLIPYSLLFAFISWYRFSWGLFVFFLLLPAYLIRLNLGPLPSTLLELNLLIITVIWFIKYFRTDLTELKKFTKKNKTLVTLILSLLFLSFLAIFVSGLDGANYKQDTFLALGIWRAYFFEPILFFIIILARKLNNKITNDFLITAIAVSTLSIAILAIIQKLTGSFFPPQLLDDNLFGRVTSFFTTPNAIGLYIAPTIPLFLYLAIKNYKIKKIYSALFTIIIILGLLAIIFSWSQGTWVGLAIGILLFIYLVGFKKTAIIIAVLGAIVSLSIPDLRQAMLFQDKAGQNRIELWSYTTNFLLESPQNFILGAGPRQFFKKIQQPHYDPRTLERIIYPHNILLNFWSEIGFFGMINFLALFIYFIYYVQKNHRNKKLIKATFISCLAIILIHGLVDVPYFKNDLAMLFWVLPVLIISNRKL